jgi:sigma-70-like protein
VTRAEESEGRRPLLFSIAYRILGSMSEAEDAVQEALSMAVSRSSIRTSSACMTFLLIPPPLTLSPSDVSPGDGPARHPRALRCQAARDCAWCQAVASS